MPVPLPAGTSFTVADPHAGHLVPVLVGKRSGVLASPSAVTLPVIANAAQSLMAAPLGDKLDANANRPAGRVQVDFGPMKITRLGCAPNEDIDGPALHSSAALGAHRGR